MISFTILEGYVVSMTNQELAELSQYSSGNHMDLKFGFHPRDSRSRRSPSLRLLAAADAPPAWVPRAQVEIGHTCSEAVQFNIHSHTTFFSRSISTMIRIVPPEGFTSLKLPDVYGST